MNTFTFEKLGIKEMKHFTSRLIKEKCLTCACDVSSKKYMFCKIMYGNTGEYAGLAFICMKCIEDKDIEDKVSVMFSLNRL